VSAAFLNHRTRGSVATAPDWAAVCLEVRVIIGDPFGNIDEVASYPLSSQIQVHWLTDGDHSFKPRKASGKSLDDNTEEAITCITKFLDLM